MQVAQLLPDQVSAPNFAAPVPPGGYAWWYLDGLSDDGRFGLTVIAFVGSVFSPYYARARRQRAAAQPENHVAINAVLYQPGGGKRWAMTERSARSLTRSNSRYQLAGSHLNWEPDQLTVEIDERCAPFGQHLRGQILLRPEALNSTAVCLRQQDQHVWHPIAPRGRLSVQFANPALHWEGTGYFDHNRGASALDSAFDYWSWSRAHTDTGTDIDYEYWPRGTDPGVSANEAHGLCSITVDPAGHLAQRNPDARHSLPTTGWRVRRNTRMAGARVARTLEDTPFYARTQLTAADRNDQIICESLDLARFRSPWVQLLLPFRMPRRA